MPVTPATPQKQQTLGNYHSSHPEYLSLSLLRPPQQQVELNTSSKTPNGKVVSSGSWLYSGREATDRAAETNAANAYRPLIGNHLAPVIYDSRQAFGPGFKSLGHIHFSCPESAS